MDIDSLLLVLFALKRSDAIMFAQHERFQASHVRRCDECRPGKAKRDVGAADVPTESLP